MNRLTTAVALLVACAIPISSPAQGYSDMQRQNEENLRRDAERKREQDRRDHDELMRQIERDNRANRANSPGSSSSSTDSNASSGGNAAGVLVGTALTLMLLEKLLGGGNRKDSPPTPAPPPAPAAMNRVCVEHPKNFPYVDVAYIWEGLGYIKAHSIVLRNSGDRDWYTVLSHPTAKTLTLVFYAPASMVLEGHEKMFTAATSEKTTVEDCRFLPKYSAVFNGSGKVTEVQLVRK